MGGDGQDTAVVIAGASGRMGQMLLRLAHEAPGMRLAGALERPGHGWIGQEVGAAMGGGALGVTVGDDPAKVLAGADAVIDFTAPAASIALAGHAARAGVAHIVGTTGFTHDERAALDRAGDGGVRVVAGNMSLGVNLLVQLTRRVAAALDTAFDIEIVEAHHRHKVDAPSGTALMLGEAAAEGRGVALADVADRGRDGITGARAAGAIGFAAIRGGDVVGEHDVIFAAPGERIVLRHIAGDRAIFARGALRAAQWARGRPAGCYDMVDVLGL